MDFSTGGQTFTYSADFYCQSCFIFGWFSARDTLLEKLLLTGAKWSSRESLVVTTASVFPARRQRRTPLLFVFPWQLYELSAAATAYVFTACVFRGNAARTTVQVAVCFCSSCAWSQPSQARSQSRTFPSSCVPDDRRAGTKGKKKKTNTNKNE